MTRRPALLALGLLASLLAAGIAVYRWANAPRPPDLLLVILDTVRAESTSLCGYERPTTPQLRRLQREEGFQVHCGMVSPGTWTVPSHAAFFTGRTVVELEEREDPAPGEMMAGRLRGRGYATALVSANMVLKQPAWLSAGFEQVRIARDFAELRGERSVEAVREVLAAADPGRPLLLVVNLIDAHAPYPAIPEGIPWLPPQGPVQHRMWQSGDTPFNRYVSGRMTKEEARRLANRHRNGYDWGVHAADAALAGIWAAWKQAGRSEHSRVVITSDHGEFVGEHQLLGHGDTLFEPGVRVPLLFRDSQAGPIPWPDPFPGHWVHPLLVDGALPDEPALAQAVTHFRASARPSYDGVALWTDDGQKLLWTPDDRHRFDLDRDPEERNPKAWGPRPEVPLLEALVERHEAAMATRAPDDDATTALLRAAGYVE